MDYCTPQAYRSELWPSYQSGDPRVHRQFQRRMCPHERRVLMSSQMSGAQTVVRPAGFHLLARIALLTLFVLCSISLPFAYEPIVPVMSSQAMFPATTAHLFPAQVNGAIVLRGSSDATDPNGFYGGCLQPPPAAGVRRKSDHVLAAGMTVVDVSSIAVIDCHGFDGPGGTFVVPCPPDSPYSVLPPERK